MVTAAFGVRRRACLPALAPERLRALFFGVEHVASRSEREHTDEAEKKAVWHSGITRIQPNKVAVRGYDIAELMGRVSFGAAVYLIITRELPSPAIARLMDAILVSSIDHGATPRRITGRLK